MATLYYAEHVHTAQTGTQIPALYLCIGQESESGSVPESLYRNINEPNCPAREIKKVLKNLTFPELKSMKGNKSLDDFLMALYMLQVVSSRKYQHE